MKANIHVTTTCIREYAKGERLNIFCLTCQKPTCSMCKVSLKIRSNRRRVINPKSSVSEFRSKKFWNRLEPVVDSKWSFL